MLRKLPFGKRFVQGARAVFTEDGGARYGQRVSLWVQHWRRVLDDEGSS
jgi:hypothetical protein